MAFNSKIFCYIRLNERESKKDEHLSILNNFISLNNIEINEVVIEVISANISYKNRDKFMKLLSNLRVDDILISVE